MFFRRKLQAKFFLLVLFFVAAFPAYAQQRGAGIVVSDHPLATQAGTEILDRGGNAVDAAIATGFALAVVDQAASGLGGGGFMIIYEARDKRAHALDFRETAPEASHADLYVRGGKPVPSLSLTGALAVAVPGEVAGLLAAMKRFGSLPLTALMAPAIRLATEGFPLDAALRYAIERQSSNMKRFPELGRIFLVKDEVPPEGEIIRQPDLGQTLKAVVAEGADVFYQGWIAQAIVDTLKRDGGVLTLEDLKSYKPVWREPLVGSYRKRTVITMPPPSSGGVALIQMLNVLEGHQLTKLAPNSATYLHLVAESMKHAFADRAQYLGDTDFIKAPIPILVSKDYAAWIRGRISPVKTHPSKYYGLGNFKAEQGGTTHFSVLDRFGNAVACTLSVNTRFGSKSLQPKKRPLSSMTPTIILQGDRPELIVGGAGGPRIISAVLQTILNVLDFQMPVKEAVEAPRIHHQWIPDELNVEDRLPPETKKSLERRGHTIRERTTLGVVQAVLANRSKTTGATDSRKADRARSE